MSKSKLSPLEEWAKFISESDADDAQGRTPIKFYANDQCRIGKIQGALKLLEVAEQEQRMPFLSAESEEHAKGFTAGQRSLIKFMKRWCGKGAKS